MRSHRYTSCALQLTGTSPLPMPLADTAAPPPPETLPVFVVSGLPRSGTSLMMRMLELGGLPVLTDGERAADVDNPRGYYELERVKRLKADSSWVQGAEGHVVKVISQLLPDLPPSHRYKVVFMRRHLDEVLASQKKMLAHRGEDNPSQDQEMKELFIQHLDETERWLRQAPHVEVLYLNYTRVMTEPLAQSLRLARFLDVPVSAEKMASAVEPSLYRNRV